MRRSSLTLFLKAAAMAAALLSLQLTKMLFGADDFLLLNMFLFVVGLHTCLTYGVQMGTLEQGRPRPRQIVASCGVAALVAAGTAYLYDWPAATALGLLLYLSAKLLERLSFNSLVAQGAVLAAYAVTLTAISIEIAAFVTVRGLLGAQGTRFLLPSLAVALAMAVPLSRVLARPAQVDGQVSMGPSHHLLFALHSFAILATMMSDRLFIATGSARMAAGRGDYLLLYSYCAALYALGVSLIEVRRPELIRLATRTPDFLTFLRESGFPRFALSVCVLACTGYGAALVLLRHAGPWLGIAADTPLPAMLGGLILFFAGFLLLAFQQVYHLATRAFATLFASWVVAGGVRAAAFLQPGWSGFLALSGLSGVAGMLCLLALGRMRKTA